MTSIFKEGDRVEKVGGDYSFHGTVQSVFTKRDTTKIRLVVENDEGILHIYSEKNLRHAPDTAT